MSNPTAWTKQTFTATPWNNNPYVVNLGALMNDTAYLMNDTILTMGDQKGNPSFAQPIVWTKT